LLSALYGSVHPPGRAGAGFNSRLQFLP
jgi:hypothetical protein